MKKDTILGFVTVVVFVLALRTVRAERIEYPEQSRNNQSRREDIRPAGRTQAEKPPIDCAECCNQGRWVSKECCIQCNACQTYRDEAAAECRDFPS